MLQRSTGPLCLVSLLPSSPYPWQSLRHSLRDLQGAALPAPQAGGASEAKLAPTSLHPIFSSQQQQEALPDETEVVEETVAEVAEVGG